MIPEVFVVQNINKRARGLDHEELERLFEGLKKSESRDLSDLVHFSLNTGCQKSEAIGLRRTALFRFLSIESETAIPNISHH